MEVRIYLGLYGCGARDSPFGILGVPGIKMGDLGISLYSTGNRNKTRVMLFGILIVSILGIFFLVKT